MIIHGVSSMNGFMTNWDDRSEGLFGLETSVIFYAKFPQVCTSSEGNYHPLGTFVCLKYFDRLNRSRRLII